MRITVLHIDTDGEEATTSLVVQSLQAIRTVLQPPPVNGHRLEATPAPAPAPQIAAPISEPAAVIHAEPPEKKSRANGPGKRCTCGVCRSCKQRQAWARRKERGT